MEPVVVSDSQDAHTSPDALDIFIRHGVQILARVGPQRGNARCLRRARAAEVVRAGEQRRVDSCREAVSVMASKPAAFARDCPKRR